VLQVSPSLTSLVQVSY